MQKDLKKTLLGFILLFGLWLMECFKLQVYFKTYVYFGAFVLSIAITYLVKKESFALIGLSAVSLAATLYNYEYLFNVMPVVLLCYAHHSVTRKLKEVKSNGKAEEGLTDTYTTLSGILMIGQVVYSLVVFQNTYPHKAENILYIMRIAPVFVLLFVLLCVEAFRNKGTKRNKTDSKVQNSFKMIYTVSIFGSILTAVVFYSVNGYGSQSYSTEYIFWFIFVMLMVLNGDPYIHSGIEKIEKKLSNI